MQPAALPEMPLLSCFAQFYEEVARVRQESERGSLQAYLGVSGAAPAEPAELAGRVSLRLADLLAGQARDMRATASEAQQRAYTAASYVMVVLADEIFILELSWPAQDAWLEVLLEHRQFGSRQAGRRFFDMAEQVLAVVSRSNLHRDLAACFLLALQLGFKGMHRGAQGQLFLDTLRQRLYRFVNGRSAEPDGRLFVQAYEHTVKSTADARVAPLRPWLRLAMGYAFGFVLVSSALWLWLIQPLVKVAGV